MLQGLAGQICLQEPFDVVCSHLIKAAHTRRAEIFFFLKKSFILRSEEWDGSLGAWLTRAVTPVVLLFYSCHHDPLSCRE